MGRFPSSRVWQVDVAQGRSREGLVLASERNFSESAPHGSQLRKSFPTKRSFCWLLFKISGARFAIRQWLRSEGSSLLPCDDSFARLPFDSLLQRKDCKSSKTLQASLGRTCSGEPSTRFGLAPFALAGRSSGSAIQDATLLVAGAIESSRNFPERRGRGNRTAERAEERQGSRRSQ